MTQEISIGALQSALEAERTARNERIMLLRDICRRAGYVVRNEGLGISTYEWVGSNNSNGGYESLEKAILGCIEVNFGKKLR